jgi:hypothetical protein
MDLRRLGEGDISSGGVEYVCRVNTRASDKPRRARDPVAITCHNTLPRNYNYTIIEPVIELAPFTKQ